VLVSADVLGLVDHAPPFAKQYVNLGEQILNAAREYAGDVRAGRFPAAATPATRT
jgi:3-methyl-2-oxobutanoate hydroxymethyltransferase